MILYGIFANRKVDDFDHKFFYKPLKMVINYSYVEGS